jgi:MFS family permease
VNGGNGNSYNPAWLQQLNDWFQQNIEPWFTHPERYISTFIWIGVGLLLFILIVGTISAIIRYVSETSVIRMVNEHEQTGTKVGFKQGWRMGWSRAAFRMWLIDLILFLPAILFALLLLGLGVTVYFGVSNGNRVATVTGIVAAIGCAFLFIFAFVILMVFLGLLRHFFVRVAVLENARVGESFRQGWQMFKSNWKSATLMWLVMLGIGIGLTVAGLVAFFLLIPVYIVLLLPAAIVAAIPGGIAFGITSLFNGGVLAWIFGGLVALPFFFLVLFAPLALIGAWIQVFNSSVWTLTYREMKALESVAPVDVPAPVE